PCPMDYLAVLLVEAVEAVDERRRARGEPFAPPAKLPVGPAPEFPAIAKAYEGARGKGTGWGRATCFGDTGVDLNGGSAARGHARTGRGDGGHGRGRGLGRCGHLADDDGATRPSGRGAGRIRRRRRPRRPLDRGGGPHPLGAGPGVWRGPIASHRPADDLATPVRADRIGCPESWPRVTLTGWLRSASCITLPGSARTRSR